jgi:hypothetical protein
MRVLRKPNFTVPSPPHSALNENSLRHQSRSPYSRRIPTSSRHQPKSSYNNKVQRTPNRRRHPSRSPHSYSRSRASQSPHTGKPRKSSNPLAYYKSGTGNLDLTE